MTHAAVAATAAARLRALAAMITRQAAEPSRPTSAPGSTLLHDLRVTCRRLETCLRLWVPGAEARVTRLRLRTIRRAAGTARELEVLVAMLRARRLGAASVPEPLRESWLKRLARAAAAANVGALPTSRVAERVQARIERLALVLERGHAPRARARERLRRWRRVARARLTAAIASGEPAALHRARLALKRWRYAEEAAAAVADGRSREPQVPLRRWQRSLGALNDRAALIAFASAAGPPGRRLVPLLEAQRLAAVRALRRRRDAGVTPSRAHSRRP